MKEKLQKMTISDLKSLLDCPFLAHSLPATAYSQLRSAIQLELADRAKQLLT